MKKFKYGDLNLDEAIEVLLQDGKFLLDEYIIWLEKDQWLVSIAEAEGPCKNKPFMDSGFRYRFAKAVQKELRFRNYYRKERF